MGVQCDINLERVGQSEFADLDRKVMRCAFDIHNEMGRFCDEKVYGNEFSNLCREIDFDACQEVKVRVSHASFSKLYFLDVLINRGVIYELKTVKALNEAHERQLINYLLLTGLSHGKLINFRPASVEHRFVSTTLTEADRKDVELVATSWHGEDAASAQLLSAVKELLEDWGAFLDAQLYREALLSLIDIPGAGVHPIPISRNGQVLGSQKLCLLTPDIAWHVSAIKEHHTNYETHLKRLLQHTHVQKLHWINFHKRKITLTTVT